MSAEQEIRARLRGQKVLVLGGNGFIGSRLVEVLAGQYEADVSVVVRTLSKAVRIARYPVHIISGDVRDAGLLSRAMDGVDLVVDLTYPNEGGCKDRCISAREMAAVIAQMAAQHRVRRVVHLSTISVYGPLKGDILDEAAPRHAYENDSYGACKLASEQEMSRYAKEKGVPIVILQPTVVYGPFAGSTLGPLSQLKSHQIVLPEHGLGICNAVYVDDAVMAILQATVRTGIEGETFLVSGDPAVTWKTFYTAYETMLGYSSTVSKTLPEICAALSVNKRAARPVRDFISLLRQNGDARQAVLHLPVIAQVYAFARLLLPESRMDRVKDGLMQRKNKTSTQAGKPRLYPDPIQLDLLSARTHVSIAKAREHLGYTPAYNLERGMRVTGEWARWAGLV